MDVSQTDPNPLIHRLFVVSLFGGFSAYSVVCLLVRQAGIVSSEHLGCL